MPTALHPNPELIEWAKRHGLDPSRIPLREFLVRPMPTKHHPRQVEVSYVALLLDASGATVGRDARSFVTCDPPPALTDTAPRFVDGDVAVIAGATLTRRNGEWPCLECAKFGRAPHTDQQVATDLEDGLVDMTWAPR